MTPPASRGVGVGASRPPPAISSHLTMVLGFSSLIAGEAKTSS